MSKEQALMAILNELSASEPYSLVQQVSGIFSRHYPQYSHLFASVVNSLGASGNHAQMAAMPDPGKSNVSVLELTSDMFGKKKGMVNVVPDQYQAKKIFTGDKEDAKPGKKLPESAIESEADLYKHFGTVDIPEIINWMRETKGIKIHKKAKVEDVIHILNATIEENANITAKE